MSSGRASRRSRSRTGCRRCRTASTSSASRRRRQRLHHPGRSEPHRHAGVRPRLLRAARGADRRCDQPGQQRRACVGGDNHECVGIAFQSLKDGQTENIGYIILTEVANHFLTDVARGGYTGFVEPAEMQRLENPSLRQLAGMKPKAASSSSSTPRRVRRQGYPPLRRAHAHRRHGERTTARCPQGGRRAHLLLYLLSQRYVGDTTTLTLLRNGKPLPPTKVDLKVHTLLVRRRPTTARAACATRPAAALVLCAAASSSGALRALPALRVRRGVRREGTHKLLDRWQYGIKEEVESQVVVLSQVLAHASLVGYEHFSNHLVTRFNGIALKSPPPRAARRG